MHAGFCTNIFISAFLLIVALPLYSQEDDLIEEGWNFKFSGYYKNLFMYQEREEFYSSIYSVPEKKKMATDINRLRLSPEINYGESFTLHADAALKEFFQITITAMNLIFYSER
jgi:hypothetical protein